MKNFKTLIKTLLLLCALALILTTAVACDFIQNLMGQAGGFDTETTIDPSETCTHETTEWVVDVNATCSTEGSKHKECVSCKKNLETATIATTADRKSVG